MAVRENFKLLKYEHIVKLRQDPFPKNNHRAPLNSLQFLFKSLITFGEKDLDSTMYSYEAHDLEIRICN